MKMEPRFGRLPAPDPRDRAHLMAAWLGEEAPLPPYRYWRTPPPIDQVGGSCVGAGWSHFIQSAPLMTKDGPAYLDLYHEAQKRDEWDGEAYEGSSVRGGAKYLTELGRLSEYLWAWDVDSIRRWVLLKGPVVVGTDWTTGMLEPDRAGYITAAGTPVGGHCYMLNGWSDARQAFRGFNSWGQTWGQAGKFWIRAGDFTTLLGRDGEACTATELRPATAGGL